MTGDVDAAQMASYSAYAQKAKPGNTVVTVMPGASTTINGVTAAAGGLDSDGSRRFYVKGDLNLGGSDAILGVGPKALSLYVGNDATIASGAVVSVAAHVGDVYTDRFAGAGGGQGGARIYASGQASAGVGSTGVGSSPTINYLATGPTI